jgi:hypothetical protein
MRQCCIAANCVASRGLMPALPTTAEVTLVVGYQITKGL